MKSTQEVTDLEEVLQLAIDLCDSEEGPAASTASDSSHANPPTKTSKRPRCTVPAGATVVDLDAVSISIKLMVLDVELLLRVNGDVKLVHLFCTESVVRRLLTRRFPNYADC